MKKNLFHRLAASFMALALIVPCVAGVGVTAADSDEVNTIYAYKSDTGEENRSAFMSEFKTNLINEGNAASSTHPQMAGTVYTEQGSVLIRANGWYNSLSPERHSTTAKHSGLPYEVLPGNFKKITENLKIQLTGASYPIYTSGIGALNLNIEYVHQGDSTANLAFERELQVYVSLDGETWLEDSVGIRSATLLGGGKMSSVSDNALLYSIETENLLDIEGLTPGARIRNIMIMPNGEYSRPFGVVRINGMKINTYQTKEAFERLVPADKIETIKVDTDVIRQIVVDEGMRVAQTKWSPDSTIYTASPGGSSLAATSTVRMTYYPWYTYSGPTYARVNDSTRELFQYMLGEDGNYRGGYTTDTVYGMDCQAFVWNAISRVSRTFAWACMITPAANRVSMVGGDLLKTNPHVAFTDQDVVNLNTAQAMFRHYSMIQPGDIVLCYVANSNNSVHTRVAKDSHVEYNADGTINGDKSYMYFTEQRATPTFDFRLANGTEVSKQMSNDAAVEEFLAENPGATIEAAHSSEWNSKWTFNELYSTFYVGFTLDEYQTGEIELPRTQIVFASKANGKPFYDGGLCISFDSNYRIIGYKVKLEDLTQGSVIYEDYTYNTEPKIVGTVCDDVALNAKLAELPNGKYRVSIEVDSGPFTAIGQTKVPTTTKSVEFTIDDRSVAPQVSLNMPTTAGANSNVQVRVNAPKAFDSADVEVKFDTNVLNYEGASDNANQIVQQDGGIVRIVRVNANSSGGEIVTLKFTAKKDVTLNQAVLLKSAMISTANDANNKDAAKATNGNEAYPSLAMKDVMPDAWYREAVDYVLNEHVMSGYSANTFGPDNTLSRAMVVQVLYNKEGQPTCSDANPFSDVPATEWFFNAVRWGAARDVVAGYGGGVFKPYDDVTIEQVAVILHNYAGKPAGNGALDSVPGCSDWAEAALRWAVEKGILNGMPFNSVTEAATRAQTAQMLMNYLKG